MKLLQSLKNRGEVMFRFKAEKEKYVPMDWHKSRELEWEKFIKACEKFDYVQFKDGRATGYMKNDLPHLETKVPQTIGEMMIQANKGTCLLIPFEAVIMYEEF